MSVQTGELTLPDEGAALKIVDGDFERAAKELDCEVAAVRAVSMVEAGGKSGFDDKKRPKILFEVHHFRDLTNRKYDKSHPHLSAPYESKVRTQSYNKDQWKVIREAFALDPEAAVQAASWGLFQILGENYQMCGWNDLRGWVTDMFASEGQHMRAFLWFCRGKGLVKHLKNRSWSQFARGFNGKKYPASYPRKMAAAYKRYSEGDKKGSATTAQKK